ncbi:hypothetical protein D9M68_692950 [compost metagenome]
MAVDHDAHAELRQAAVVAQLRVAVGDQHQRDAQVPGDGFQVLEVADADHADGVRAGGLVGEGAADHVVHLDHLGVGAGDDRHVLVDPRFQRRADLADAFLDRDQVGGLAAELRRQQGVLDGQRGDAGALQFHHRAHGVQRVAVAVVGVGDHRQAGDAADAGGLLDEFAEGDQGEVRRRQDLQGGDRAAEDADFEAEVGGDARGHRIEHRGGVVAGMGIQQRAKGRTQFMVGSSLHGEGSSCSGILMRRLYTVSNLQQPFVPIIRPMDEHRVPLSRKLRGRFFPGPFASCSTALRPAPWASTSALPIPPSAGGARMWSR